jgi:hypothetical protein
VKNFEINLDKYWEAQEFKYDHTDNINLTSKPGSDVKLLSSIVEEEVTRIILRPLSTLSLDEGLNALNGKTPSTAV